jgi:DNA-binding NtrC family response regulator
MNVKALVVDRRSMERNVLTLPLQQIGVRKVTELNREELAGRRIRSGEFDIAFIEFHTLMEAGRGLVDSLRTGDATLPIVVTYPSTVTVADLKKYCPDAAAYLLTPFTKEQLRESVAQLLPVSVT